MCRHVGYLGDDRTLASVVTQGNTSLYRQSYEPRLQRHGTVNADGWGIGWFTDVPDLGPARHRSARPIWADPFVGDVAPHVRSGCVVAAVRSATPPAPIEQTGAAPFTDGALLFSHNGAVDDFVQRIGPVLRRTLAPQIEGTIIGSTDSEVLFACIRQAHATGSLLPDAVAHTVHAVLAMTPARLNLLVGEADRLIATALGDTLFTRRSDAGAWVASEPTDDESGWTEVPDGSLVTVTAETTTVVPL
jgi:glutamine amidotransferase